MGVRTRGASSRFVTEGAEITHTGLQCPCGGRRTIRSLQSTRKQAEARLAELGVALPSRQPREAGEHVDDGPK